MALGINNFPALSTTSNEVPGAVIQNIGKPVRRLHPKCEGCAKSGAHKGWIAYGFDEVTTHDFEKYTVDGANQVCQCLMQLQAMNHMQGVHAHKVPKFNADANGDKHYAETSFEVVSVGSYIVCKYTGGAVNDPRNQDGFTLCDWGFLELYGTQVPEFDGINAQVHAITDPDGSGDGTITFRSYTSNIGGRLASRANPAVPISAVFRRYKPGLIYSALQKLYPMACKYEVQTLSAGSLTEGVNTIFSDGKHISCRDRKVEKIVSGEATQINPPFINVPVSGVNHVVLDLTEVDLSEEGLTDIRISCWVEGAPIPAAVETSFENTDPPTAIKYTVATNERLVGTPLLECRTGGSDWHSEGGSWGSGTFYSDWNEATGWYDIFWDLTGSDLMWQPDNIYETPDPIPEGWEPPPPPPPISIDGIRAIFNASANPGGDFHMHADRCGKSCPIYANNTGLPEGDARWHCTQWVDLTTDEKNKYQPRCFNEKCQFFGQGNLGSDNIFSPTTIGGIHASLPYKNVYGYLDGYGGETTGTRSIRGAHSQTSNTSMDLDAPADVAHQKTENAEGCGGWGKVGSTSYTYTQEETHWEYPEEGEPYEVTETVEYTVNNTALVGEIQNIRVKTPQMAGYGALHRNEGDWRGHWTRKRRFKRHCVIYPQLTSDAVQEFQDGTVELGFWKADFTKQDGEDADTAYRTLVKIRQGIKHVKDLKRRDLSVVKTIRLAERNVTGDVSIRNIWTTYTRPNGTGNEEYQFSARVGHAVLKISDLPTNWACPESLSGGAGTDEYIIPRDLANDEAGMGLRIPDDPGIPEQFRRLIFPILTATPCAGIIDPDWDVESYKCESALYLPVHFWDDYKFCDVLTLQDEQGQLAALNAAVDLTQFDLDVVEQPWCGSYNDWIKSKPDVGVADSAITTTALPSSGLFFFEENLSGWCIVGSIDQADFASFMSIGRDLGTLAATQANMMATTFQSYPMETMAANNKEYSLKVDYERWRYNYDHTQILGDETANKFVIDDDIRVTQTERSDDIFVGVDDVFNDETPLWKFQATVFIGAPPFRSRELDRLFCSGSQITYAAANTTIVVTSSGILRTLHDDGSWTDDDLNESWDAKLALFGINPGGTWGLTYTNLGSVSSTTVAGDGRWRTYPMLSLAQAYANNKCDYAGFCVVPVVGDWALQPGSTPDKDFLYRLFQQGIQRNLWIEDNMIKGTVKLRQFGASLGMALSGVMQLSSSYSLPSDARVIYRKPPAYIKQ